MPYFITIFRAKGGDYACAKIAFEFSGYDRELRNWPKYSMHGDPDKGEHDLVITSVSREDAGNFECQVSPNANQPLLRRSTNLSVLGKFSFDQLS